MHISTRKKVRITELNMTPMIDVVFLLITFFMLVTEITRQDDVEDLQLPDITTAVDDDDPDPGRLVINIAVEAEYKKKSDGTFATDKEDRKIVKRVKETGIVIISGATYSLWERGRWYRGGDVRVPDRTQQDKIKELLAVEARISGKQQDESAKRIVLVKADRHVPFRDIRAIMRLCVDDEVKIKRLAFGTMPKTGKKRPASEEE